MIKLPNPKRISRRISQWVAALLVLTLTLAPYSAVSAAAPSTSVRQAQSILTKFTIPVGPIDGAFGPQTARGLCAFRYMAGYTPTRGGVTSALSSRLRSYNSTYSSLGRIPAPTLRGHTTYVVVQKKCQAMFYVQNSRYVRVLAVSTGMAGHNTPNGAYTLGGTKRGWSCSTLYPESCGVHNVGRFASISNRGNMYNQRFFRGGGYFVHGSTSVPTYPASHGCIRVTVNDADWMYDHVGNSGAPYMIVTGEY